MDFQVSSPSNHFLFFLLLFFSNIVCNYSSTMGALLIGRTPQGREAIAVGGQSPRGGPRPLLLVRGKQRPR